MRSLVVLAAVLAIAAPASAVYWWDQLCPTDDYGAASWIDYDTPSDALTADDFLCNAAGPITDIWWTGWSYYGEQYIQAFRISFWSDVPETPNDESHPGDLLWVYDVYDFQYVDPPECGYGYEYYAHIEPDNAFWQEPGNIYWISIQGIMVTDGYFDAWYWHFYQRGLNHWGDDAAFYSNYFGYPPWYNWGVDGTNNVNLYNGPFPAGWLYSLDMSFRLAPEPASLLLLGLGVLTLRRR